MSVIILDGNLIRVNNKGRLELNTVEITHIHFMNAGINSLEGSILIMKDVIFKNIQIYTSSLLTLNGNEMTLIRCIFNNLYIGNINGSAINAKITKNNKLEIIGIYNKTL
jgi:hypothetical protein